MSAQKLKNDIKGFWAVAWRSLIVGPLIFPLGAVLFVIAIFAPFLVLVAAALLYEGEYSHGCASLAVWIVWFVFRRPLNRFVFEGFEHSGM